LSKLYKKEQKQRVPSRQRPGGLSVPSHSRRGPSSACYDGRSRDGEEQDQIYTLTTLVPARRVQDRATTRRKQRRNMTPMEVLKELLGITEPTASQKVMLAQLVRVWATSTWRTRCSVWSRFKEWAGSNTTPENAVTWLAMKVPTNQTRHTYAKALLSLFNHSVRKLPTAALRLYTKALVADGALVPIRQAKPLSKYKVAALARRLECRHKARGAAIAVKLAYKVCGRWTQTAGVTPRMCPTISDEMIVIAWGQTTKTSRNKPYSKSMYTVCKGDWTPEIAAYLRTLPIDKPITDWNVQRLNRVIRAMFGKGHHSHGIKHGAIQRLLELVVQGVLTLEEVQVIAQHESLVSTLRYGGSPTNMALALGTQRASSLL